MALLPGGGYGEFVTVNSNHIMHVPESMSFETAAAIPEVWCTAYQLLHFSARIHEGESALVLAAASGVGTALTQLLKKNGNEVFAVASN